MGQVSSLAAYRGSFSLAYSSPFTSRITQSPRVKCGGLWPQNYKHIRFGRGFRVPFDCHVIFPRLGQHPGRPERKSETHLTNVEQEIWINRIVLPALRRTCRCLGLEDVLQYHPQNYQEAQYKSTIRTESAFDGPQNPFDVRYALPEDSLALFSKHIRELANSSSLQAQFGGLLFYITRHDLKGDTRYEGAFPGFQEKILAYLNTQFHLDHFIDQDFWIDIAKQVTPISDSRVKLTLLYKSHCLNWWARQFKCPGGDSKSRTKHTAFTWSATRDAGSASVEILPTNQWFQHGLMAYHKKYNLVKHIHTTPEKNFGPTDGSSYEALAFSQSLIEEFYRQNSSHHGGKSAKKRQSLLKAWHHLKGRLSTMATRRNDSFGVREEYRINIRLFHSPDFNPDLPPPSVSGLTPLASTSSTRKSLPSHQRRLRSSTLTMGKIYAPEVKNGQCLPSRRSPAPPSPSPDVKNTPTASPHIDRPTHHPFWILRTRDVIDFMTAQVNRWVLIVEIMTSRVQGGPRGILPASREEQILNGAMVTLGVHLVRFSFGAVVPTSRKLWRDRYPSKKMKRGVLSEEETPISMEQGLNIQHAFKRYGYVRLPPRYFLWHQLAFTPEAYKIQGLTRSGFGAHFRAGAELQTKVSSNDYLMRLIMAWLRAAWDALEHTNTTARDSALQAVFRGISELVIQRFIWALFHELCNRKAGPGYRSATQRIEDFRDFIKRLTPLEAHGLSGLTVEMIQRLIQHEPLITFVRPSKKPLIGEPIWPRPASPLWEDKVRPLFDFRPGKGFLTKAPGWDEKPYRRLTKDIYGKITDHFGSGAASDFVDILVSVASRFLWVIPLYNPSSISGVYDPKGRKKIETMHWTPLQKTNWSVPQLRPALHESLRTCDRFFKNLHPAPTQLHLHHITLGDRTGLKANIRRLQRIRNFFAHRDRSMEVLRGNTHKKEICLIPGIPTRPGVYGAHLELTYAKEILAKLYTRHPPNRQIWLEDPDADLEKTTT